MPLKVIGILPSFLVKFSVDVDHLVRHLDALARSEGGFPPHTLLRKAARVDVLVAVRRKVFLIARKKLCVGIR